MNKTLSSCGTKRKIRIKENTKLFIQKRNKRTKQFNQALF